MAVPLRSSNLGRHLFGAACLVSGLATAVWHDHPYAAAGALIFGGVAVQFRRTALAGALVLAAVYLVFTLLCVPLILATPRTYNPWGNFFEQFSLLLGAALIYASSPWGATRENLVRAGRISLGLCATSFALEQVVYLNNTSVLVPKWLPPGQEFWAIATTVLFALAAIALVTNRVALLAARLLTLMLVSFGMIVWVPLLVSSPRSQTNWSETAETFAIAGTAWILADLCGAARC